MEKETIVLIPIKPYVEGKKPYPLWEKKAGEKDSFKVVAGSPIGTKVLFWVSGAGIMGSGHIISEEFTQPDINDRNYNEKVAMVEFDKISQNVLTRELSKDVKQQPTPITLNPDSAIYKICFND